MKRVTKNIFIGAIVVVCIFWFLYPYFIGGEKFHISHLMNPLFARLALFAAGVVFCIIVMAVGRLFDPLRKCPKCKKKLISYSINYSTGQVKCKLCGENFTVKKKRLG